MAWDYVFMSLPVASTSSVDKRRWLDDLSWHRQVYRQSKFRWWDTDALLVATEFTRGRQEFKNLRELRELENYRLELSAYTLTCQRALGMALKDVRAGLTLQSWDEVGQALSLCPLECSENAHFATWFDLHDRTQISNPQVRRVTRMCEGFFFASPVLLAWELNQLVRLYQAAENLLEDTLVDLAVELRETVRIDDVVRAAGMATEAGLNARIDAQRQARGEVGDRRRHPLQTYPPLTV